MICPIKNGSNILIYIHIYLYAYNFLNTINRYYRIRIVKKCKSITYAYK